MSHVIRGRPVKGGGGGGGADKFCWDRLFIFTIGTAGNLFPGIRKTDYLFWIATNSEKEKKTKNDKYEMSKLL